MPTSVTITVAGMDSAISMIVDMVQSAPDKINAAMSEVGTEAKDVMDSHTPVRTGRLKRGNLLTQNEDGFTLSNATPNDKGTIYSGFVNYGTRRMAAQPFLEPAVEYIFQVIEERVSVALKP